MKTPHVSIAFALCAGTIASAGPWASRVVYGILDGQPVYEPGVGEPVTFGPFDVDALWSDPEALIGKPNTLDYDDLAGWGPVPGGFAGGPMRRVHLAWPAWQWGSNDPDCLGERPGWLDGRRKNGLGLRAGGRAVVEFDPPIGNNPDDGGAFHWGVDFIVHGNAFFASIQGISGDTPMDAVVLSGSVMSEPVVVSVAQTITGPWYTFERTADDLFPTQPWAWNGGWTGEEQDWTKPVDPRFTAADFAGITAAGAIGLYAGSAGGTPFDLDWLTDDAGNPVQLEWIRFVRLSDPLGMQGEICGVVDVPPAPPGSGCNPADLAEPFGVLDLADITVFVSAFVSGDPAADLAEPAGVFDLADISAFVAAFVGGCP